MTTLSLCDFAETCDSDLRFIPCGTNASAKSPLDVTTGYGLDAWSSYGVDCDDLRKLLESEKATHQPRAIGINLSLSGVSCLDCDEEGWIEDLADLAECSVVELRSELQQLSYISSPRVIVGERKAIKFLFRLPQDVTEQFLAIKPGLQITESENEKKWALFSAGKQVVIYGEYDDKGFTGNYKPEGLDEIKEAGPLLIKAILARLALYPAPAFAPITGVVASPVTDLSDAVRRFLFPVAEQFSTYDSWLKTGMAFHSLGDEYLSTWIEFCSHMEGFDETECLNKWATFKRQAGGVGIGSLYFWLSKQGWRGGDALKEKHPIETRIDLLQEGLKEIAEGIRSAWKRRAHADDLNDALGKPVKAGGLDAALAEAIASVREERSKTPRRASSWDAFISEADEAAIVDWLVYGLIARGDSHLLVAPAKEGKTSTLAALLIHSLLGNISSMEERPGSILWFSDDQARTKTAGYLKAAAKGIRPEDWKRFLEHHYNQGGLIVDDRFNLTPDGIEELIEEVRLADRPVVVIDSLASVCRKLGLKENDSSFANVIYELGESVKEANPEATLIIIHHSTKSGMKDKGALESVRGSGAIVGAVDNVINISKPLKTSRGGSSAVADDQSPEREIHVNGRIPGGKYFIDLEFEMETVDHPERPGKSYQKLDTIKVTQKAESTHQEASEVSLGPFQDQVLNHLREYNDQEWTTAMIAADLEKDQAQVSRALKTLLKSGKAVSRRDGREVFYQAT